MKIRTTQTLSNGITLSIIEVENAIAQEFFNNRFQIMVEIKNKRYFPKNKQKYLNFKEFNDYIYKLKSDITGQEITMNPPLYNELQLCDMSLENCNCGMLCFVSMYNQGINLKKELKKTYKI